MDLHVLYHRKSFYLADNINCQYLRWDPVINLLILTQSLSATWKKRDFRNYFLISMISLWDFRVIFYLLLLFIRKVRRMFWSYGSWLRLNSLNLQHKISFKILISISPNLKFIITEISPIEFVQFDIFKYLINNNIFMRLS